ncbi:MAG: tetratricopeptide repeat protein [Desulfarculus sp.]|nr:tetratricopeptide repeat protein [Desulfarculus sp.]
MALQPRPAAVVVLTASLLATAAFLGAGLGGASWPVEALGQALSWDLLSLRALTALAMSLDRGQLAWPLAGLFLALEAALAWGLYGGRRWAWPACLAYLGLQALGVLVLLALLGLDSPGPSASPAGALVYEPPPAGTALLGTWLAALTLRLATLAWLVLHPTLRYFWLWGPLPQPKPADLEGLLAQAEELDIRGRRAAVAYLYQRLLAYLEGPAGQEEAYQGLLARVHRQWGLWRLAQGQAEQACPSLRLAQEAGLELPGQARDALAQWLAGRGAAGSQDVPLLLSFVEARAAQPQDPGLPPVLDELRRLLRVDEHSPRPQARWATEGLTRLARALPDLDWAHYQLGLAWSALEDYAAAAQAMGQARRLNPTRWQDARHLQKPYRAQDMASRGRHAPALEIFQELIQTWPGPRTWLAMGQVKLAWAMALSWQDMAGPPPQVGTLARQALDLARQALDAEPSGHGSHLLAAGALTLLGRPSEALAAARQAWRLAPRVAQAAIQLARCLEMDARALGDPLAAASQRQEGLKVLGQVEAEQAGRPQVLIARGLLELGLGLAAPAAQTLAKAGRLCPHDGEVMLALGQAHWMLRSHEQAAQALQPLAAHNRAAAYLLARCQSRQGRFDKAAALLEGLLSHGLATAKVHYWLGSAQAHQGLHALAAQSFQRSLEIKPGWPDALAQLGHCHCQAGRGQEARQAYQEALAGQDGHPGALRGLAPENQPHWYSQMLLGAAAEMAGDDQAAQDHYRLAAQRRPQRGEAMLRLGLLLAKGGQREEALPWLERAAKLPARQEEALYHLGLVSAEAQDYHGALASWEALAQRRPQDQRLALNIERLRYLAGLQDLQAGRYQQAAKAWERYLQSRQDDQQLRRDLAELYFRWGASRLAAGDADEARRHLEAALGQDPAHAAASFYMTLHQLIYGDRPWALGRLSELARQDGGGWGARARYYLGLDHLRQGRNQEAAALLAQVPASGQGGEAALPVSWALALAHAREQRWDQALAALDGAGR